MNDLFLTLAQAPGGLTCLVLPRVLPDGTRNAIRLQRLKDKLGNRSNASSEIEYDGRGRVAGRRRGPRRRDDHRDGLDDPAGLRARLGRARSAARVTEAAHHVAHRAAFGRTLADTAADAGRAGRRGRRSPRPRRCSRCGSPAPSTGARRALLRLALPDGEVHGLQAHVRARRRGAGVPGRQRLRRGVGAAAALPGGAAELDLGGLGQRHGAGRAARHHPRAARRRGPAVRTGHDGRRRPPPRRGRRHAAGRAVHSGRAPRAAAGRARRRVPAGIAAGPPRPGRGRRHVPDLPVRRRPVPHRGHPPVRRRGRAAGPRDRRGVYALDRSDAGARGPPLADLVERLVAERVHARPGGQRVRGVHVQALDPVGHAARADLRAERLDRVALGQVRLVRARGTAGELPGRSPAARSSPASGPRPPACRAATRAAGRSGSTASGTGCRPAASARSARPPAARTGSGARPPAPRAGARPSWAVIGLQVRLCDTVGVVRGRRSPPGPRHVRHSVWNHGHARLGHAGLRRRWPARAAAPRRASPPARRSPAASGPARPPRPGRRAGRAAPARSFDLGRCSACSLLGDVGSSWRCAT